MNVDFSDYDKFIALILSKFKLFLLVITVVLKECLDITISIPELQSLTYECNDASPKIPAFFAARIASFCIFLIRCSVVFPHISSLFDCNSCSFCILSLIRSCFASVISFASFVSVASFGSFASIPSLTSFASFFSLPCKEEGS
eukprot:TRINITY_DN5941_c0_g1_i1.p1 TRINITY_DN5941_c0_g1~~TRINITY_DN5941_c0_g1_i1.p1  ORF type:complete len:144 (+),score=27.09 TRINITY_DN5941_c0_g1_i1:538-969(+)